MILSGWAKTKQDIEQFNGEDINSVEVAFGKNERDERATFFVLTRKTGAFTSKTVARYECHRMHDLCDPGCEIRKWLLNNLDHDYLVKKIQQEKESYLTKWHRSAARLVIVEFENSDLNYSTGIADGVTEEVLTDFYVYNEFEFPFHNNKKHECISIKIIDNEQFSAVSKT